MQTARCACCGAAGPSPWAAKCTRRRPPPGACSPACSSQTLPPASYPEHAALPSWLRSQQPSPAAALPAAAGRPPTCLHKPVTHPHRACRFLPLSAASCPPPQFPDHLQVLGDGQDQPHPLAVCDGHAWHPGPAGGPRASWANWASCRQLRAPGCGPQRTPCCAVWPWLAPRASACLRQQHCRNSRAAHRC